MVSSFYSTPVLRILPTVEIPLVLERQDAQGMGWQLQSDLTAV